MHIPFTVRQCRSHEDLKLCVELQRRIWWYGDEDLVPAAIFVVAQHTGGHALCAFDGSTPAGFALAFSAEQDGSRSWHSHMAGVLPEYQNRGAGRLLKLCQREEALRAGVDRIQWTFDPLELRNAYFNICRLGVAIRHYIPNCYGRTTSPLHGDLPTDRALAEWRLSSARVAAAARNEAPPQPGLDLIKIPISANIAELKRADPSQACQWQAGLRRRLQDLFSRGYAITGFERGSDTCHYLLERYAD